MKKYLLGILALIGIGVFSAFSIDMNQKKELKYFFYKVESGVVDPSSPLNTEPMTLSEFDLFNPIDCPVGDDIDCIRAWEETNTPTATGADDHTITRRF